MNIWYLAHPVASDRSYSMEQNLAHALKIARVCHDAGFKVCLPWWTDIHYLDDENPEHRAQGLEMDCRLVQLIGRMILVGHKFSYGMSKEYDALLKIDGPIVIDAIGISADRLPAYLQSFRQ